MKCVNPVIAPVLRDWVPCGKCNACLKVKRETWSHRLHCELKAADSAAFLTFTYDQLSLVYDIEKRTPALEKTHVQNLVKRIRKREWKKHRSQTIRYYGVGEYGGDTLRPHYHLLLFNFHLDTLGTIADIWGKGHVDVGKVEPASIAYVTGYVINDAGQLDESVRQFPFTVMSRGVGKQFLTPARIKYHKQNLKPFAESQGNKFPLSRYYKDRIFNKHQKELMRVRTAEYVEKRYLSEIDRLRQLTDDPAGYYSEMQMQAFDRVRTTKVKKRKAL